MTDTKNSLICVGVIASAHGIQGLVKIKPFTESFESFLHFKTFLKKDGTELDKLSVKGEAQGKIIARIASIQTRNEAETSRGTKLYVEQSSLPTVGEAIARWVMV